VLIDGQDVKCKESELTGEPDDMPKSIITEKNYKDELQGVLLAKSLCVDGFGKGVVTAVGMQTESGIISAKQSTME